MATMKTLNGYGFDSAKLGGRAPEYYTNPRNLLCNSDFTNPVNQRGQTTYNAGGYTIDGWSIWSVNGDASLTLVKGGIAFNPGTGSGTFTQKLPLGLLDSAKTYTLAVHKSNGETRVKTDGVVFNHNGNGDLITISTAQETIVWAALYEGFYTAETLPPYVPKGKHVEMLNCGVSLTPHNLLDNSDFTNPVNQRGAGGTYDAWGGYTIDRWATYADGATVNLTSQGLSLHKSIYQPIGADTMLRYNGKHLTYAVKIDGVVYVASGLFEQTGVWHRIQKVDTPYGHITLELENDNSTFCVISNNTSTATIEWAALYEGSYTADTLPPYVPKGYAAEFAECRRYYKRFTAPYAGIAGTGYVTGSTKYIYINPPDNYPMRINKPSFVFKGVINVRGINGYIVEDYGDAVIRVYENATGCIPTLEIVRGDSAAWNATNNTPIAVQFHANSVLELIADL